MKKKVYCLTILLTLTTIASGFIATSNAQVQKMDVLSSATTEGGNNSSTKTTMVLKINDKYMTLNGERKEVDPGKDTSPIIVDGRTLVPIRAIIEGLGGTIGWNDEQKKASLSLNNNVVNVWINKMNGNVNGQSKKLDVAPKIVNGRTMIPLRFVTENLGCQVSWDDNSKSITITN